jgi:acyl-CoA synthetase (AMP-forming)/AMP-acid ligase II
VIQRREDRADVAVPDDTWGEVGVAFIVGSATEDELTQYLALRVAKYKVPKRFVFLDALPRTPYGKVVKDELKKRFAELLITGSRASSGRRPPGSTCQ